MTISKHRRRKMRQSAPYARYNSDAANHARRSAANDARRLADEPPVYPAELRGGASTGDYLDLRVWGHRITLDLRAPYAANGRRPRCETMSVWDGDEMVQRAAGVTALLALVREMLHPYRPASRKLLASLQQGYTARDEADCAAAAISPSLAAGLAEN